MCETFRYDLSSSLKPVAESVFGFGVQGEVATSTHAGLPWLLYRQSMPKQKTVGPVEKLRAYSPGGSWSTDNLSDEAP